VKLRSVIVVDSAGLRITIPSHLYWFLVVFLTPWVTGLGYGLFSSLSKIIYEETERTIGLLAFELVLWSAWLYGVYLLLWNLGGREIVCLNDQSLMVRREIWGVGFSKEFLARGVSDVRSSMSDKVSFISWRWGMGERIRFSYAGKTYSFGKGLEESEVQNLIKILRERYLQ
jgi:hypothetical protein